MHDPIVSRSTPWKTVILTCGKCARKMNGGYGPTGKDTLRTALNASLKGAGRRREVRLYRDPVHGGLSEEGHHNVERQPTRIDHDGAQGDDHRGSY